MSFLPLSMPPGVFRSGTEYQAKGRWYDAHLVRWYDSKVLGPVLGWVQKSTSAVSGAARAIVTWRANDGFRRAAIGTHSKLYAMASDGVLSDICPAGSRRDERMPPSSSVMAKEALERTRTGRRDRIPAMCFRQRFGT